MVVMVFIYLFILYVLNDTKMKYFGNLYLLYITYVSYSTRDLLKVHVLNKYNHQNSLMRSYSSRVLITKKQFFFAVYRKIRAKCTAQAVTSPKP